MRIRPRSGSGARRGALFTSFYFVALLFLGACASQQQATGPFPRFAEYEGDEVTDVTFSGDIRFPQDSLQAVVRTRASRCQFLFLPICIPFTDLGRDEYRLNRGELAQDVARVQLYHRDHGFYGALVEPNVESTGEDEVVVDFVIAPGRQVFLQELSVEGTDTIVPLEALSEAMPLEVGQPFGRVDFLASADTIRRRLLQQGYAYADVLRNYGIDTIAGTAEAEFVAIPGPVVYVDTILFEGSERLNEGTLRRQLTFTEGEILRAAELNDSQRNLYNLNMISLASVRLAPDTLQEAAAEEQATVLVQLVEAAQYAVEAAIGFGTVDCLRTSGRWTNRNFIGGGRRLEVLGSLSRIGVGQPTDVGLDRSVCAPLGQDEVLAFSGIDFRDRLDYNLAADFQQPRVLGTQNQLGINLHTERRSEAEAYIRESIGGRVSAVREIDGGATVLTTTLDIGRGRTLASPAILCVGFDTCTQQDLELLQQHRWSNALTFAALRDGQRAEGSVTRGYVARGAVDWASAILGSQDRFLRLVTEGSYYYPIGTNTVLAGNLRVGRFLRGFTSNDGYIPPERRFYAGGPNSVRGYARNALGPISYVIIPERNDTVGSATGGTQTVISSVELRMRSPWLSEIMRLAAFIDAGHVSALGSELLEPARLRVTPGVGVRFVTPVGPFRLDVAYNPYDPQPGPLYRVDRNAGMILDRPSYRPDSPSFWGRFRLQFALGQAF